MNELEDLLKEREMECILECRNAANNDAVAWAIEAIAIALHRIANAIEFFAEIKNNELMLEDLKQEHKLHMESPWEEQAEH